MIRLREVTDTDIEIIEKWLYLDHIKPWYTEPQDWLFEITNRKGEFSWLRHFIVEKDGKAFGFAQFYDCYDAKEDWYEVDSKEEMFSIDYLIGEESFLGKGYGKQIVKLLTENILKVATAKQIIVQPDKENALSCAVLKANGYYYNKDKKYYILNL